MPGLEGGSRAPKARLDSTNKLGMKRKSGPSRAEKTSGGAMLKQQKREGEGSSSSRPEVKRQASLNCTTNRNCALLDGALPLSYLAEPCGDVCVFMLFWCVYWRAASVRVCVCVCGCDYVCLFSCLLVCVTVCI